MNAWGWLALAGLLLALLTWVVVRRKPAARAVPTPFREIPVHELAVGEWRYRYHISGSGPELLLLHGIGADLFCWRFLIPYLARRYKVVAVDLPGFGQSSKPTSAHYGLDEQADRLHDFLAALQIRQTYIVGNSMGANIGLWMAVKFPDLCRGCAVIAPAVSTRWVPIPLQPWLWLAQPLAYVVNRRGLHFAHRLMVSRKDRVDQERVEETFRTYGRNPAAVRSFLAATESLRDRRLGQSLGQIRQPVLILWGSADRMVPSQVIDSLEAALPAAKAMVHSGGGHHLQEDEPEWVSEKIDSFFSTKVV